MRASWYTVLALSKQCRSDDISESRLLMESGMFFRIDGGWLDFLCTYNGTLPKVWRMFASQKTVFSNLITELSFSMFYSKITLTNDHDIPKRSQYNNLIFRYIALYRIKDIYYKSRNNPLVNSQPEIHLILVNMRNTRSTTREIKRAIEMLLCHIVLRDLTLTLKITDTLPLFISGGDKHKKQ